MPLVLGMVLCLLLLGAGVTAATSVFLARANLQHVCDGAASAGAEAVQRTGLPDGSGASSEIALQAAAGYLAPRAADARLSATVDGSWTTLACSRQAPVAFGVIFGAATVEINVDAVGKSALPQENF